MGPQTWPKRRFHTASAESETYQLSGHRKVRRYVRSPRAIGFSQDLREVIVVQQRKIIGLTGATLIDAVSEHHSTSLGSGQAAMAAAPESTGQLGSEGV